MPSHYTTSGLSSLVGREGIENLVFGPGGVRSQNIHFTFSGAVGRKDAANMPGTGSMDGSQSRRRTRTEEQEKERERERKGWKGNGREGLDGGAGVDC